MSHEDTGSRLLRLGTLLAWAASLLWAAALLEAAPARAQTITPSPSVLSMSVSRTTPTLTVRYDIDSSAGGGSIQVPLVASPGEFRLSPNAPAIGKKTPPLAVVTPSSDGVLTVPTSTVERFRVPADVTAAARQAGTQTIFYSRVWTYPSVPPPAIPTVVQIRLTGGLSGPFQVTRFELRFEDNTELRIAQQLERFRAVANVSYSGTGVFDAVWEVASPAQARSIQSQTNFRILKRLRRRLDGTGRIFLESPYLPTTQSGLHLVRLRFLVPDTAFELRPVRYFVSQGRSPTSGGVPSPLRLAEPPHMGRVDASSRFGWASVPGAAAYQFEMFAGPELRAESSRPESALETSEQRSIERSRLVVPPQPPTGQFVAGTVLPGTQTSFTFSQPMLAKLEPGRRYFWRVRAIGVDGSILADSPVHEVLLSRSAGIPRPSAP